MKFGVIVFPGSNCDHDAYHVISNTLTTGTQGLW
jgi:phosphoribosylformylglycinamidine synthase